MQTKKKAVFNFVFLAVVFILTIYGIFHGQNLSELSHAIRNADIKWLIPGVFLVFFFIYVI